MFDINYAELFKSLPPQLAVVLIAVLPIAELRVSIPVGLTVYKMPIMEVFFLSVLANIFAAFVVLYSIGFVYNFLKGKIKIVDIFFDWLFKRTRRNFFQKYEIWGDIALMIFVAIPLPATGAWTGALAAWIFGLEKKKSLFYISLGVIIAGIIVTFVSLGMIKIF